MIVPASQLLSAAGWLGLAKAAMILAVGLGATIVLILVLKLAMWIFSKASKPLTNGGRNRQIREQAEFNLAVREEENRLTTSGGARFRPLSGAR